MKTTFQMFKFLAGSSVFSLCLSQNLGASPSDLGDSESFGVDWGHSCQILEELDESLIEAMTHPSHVENFASFCYADDSYSCSDYNGLLYDLGSLVERGDGYCSFIPN